MVLLIAWKHGGGGIFKVWLLEIPSAGGEMVLYGNKGPKYKEKKKEDGDIGLPQSCSFLK